MTYSWKFAVLVWVFSQGVWAKEYRIFITGNYSELGSSSSGIKSAFVDISGYLRGRETLGPLNEFAYINTIGVFIINMEQLRYPGIIDVRFSRSLDVFYRNFLFGVNYGENTLLGVNYRKNTLLGVNRPENNADKENESFKFGYLINDNFLVSAQRTRMDVDRDDALSSSVRSIRSYDTTIQVQYNHALDGRNYIGVTAKSTIEGDSELRSIESKYFTELGYGQYLSVNILYGDYEDEKFWSTDASYYFSKYTSLSASYDDIDRYTVNGSHYFTDNFSLHAGYANSAKDSLPFDFREVSIGAGYQF